MPDYWQAEPDPGVRLWGPEILELVSVGGGGVLPDPVGYGVALRLFWHVSGQDQDPACPRTWCG